MVTTLQPPADFLASILLAPYTGATQNSAFLVQPTTMTVATFHATEHGRFRDLVACANDLEADGQDEARLAFARNAKGQIIGVTLGARPKVANLADTLTMGDTDTLELFRLSEGADAAHLIAETEAA